MEVKLNNISYSYKKVNYQPKTVLKGVSATFKPGKVTGIIGDVGSGKSTLLEILSTTLIASGTTLIDGIEFTEKELKSNLKSIQSQIGFSEEMPDMQFIKNTVSQELIFQMQYYNYRLDQIDKRIVDSLKMVGLNYNYLNRKINTLSDGEKRKLSIALALIHNPKMVILDEPTSGLDYKSKIELIRLIRLLKNRYKKTIVVATKDMEFLHKIVDYIYVLDNKKIVLEGTKYDVFKNSKVILKCNLKVPKVVEFSSLVLDKKKVRIGYRDEINDLIKDIYRYVK